MILDQLELLVVILLEYFEFYIQAVGIIFGPKKLSNTVLTFAKVHIVSTSQLFQGNSSFVCHEWLRKNAGSWKKWFFCEWKLKNDFVAAFRYLYTHLYSHCHVTIPYMESVSFFGRFVQKVIRSCFSDSFVQKTTQQSDGGCHVKSDSQFSYKLSKKQLLRFCKHIWKTTVIKKYRIARHDDKICFLPNCRYHILLIGNIKELRKKLDAFCFNYQHVDCLYTIFKYRCSGKFVVKRGQLFDNMQRAVFLNHQNRGVDRMPRISKKRLLRKKYRKHLFSSFQKNKSTKTSESIFADRIEQFKKTELEFELIKIVDCFLDGPGNYASNLVSFKIK